MLEWRHQRPIKVLTVDLENRPLSYRGYEQTSAEITAIAISWGDPDKIECKLLTNKAGSMVRMLEWFRKKYDEADLVTGHFIRRHDLPILISAYLENGLPLLGPKLTSDTFLDLVKRKDLSASQENLAAMYGLEQEKAHMNQDQWRKANRLLSDGIALARERVEQDVRQHMALRARLIEAGALKAPKIWHP